MIDAALRRTIETLRRTVTSADLELDDLTTVLLIGGSSRIPAVAQLISVELELPVAIDSDPKASISLGAAVAAARLLEPISGSDAARRHRTGVRRAARGSRRTRRCRSTVRSRRSPAPHVDRPASDGAGRRRRGPPRTPDSSHAAGTGHAGASRERRPRRDDRRGKRRCDPRQLRHRRCARVGRERRSSPTPCPAMTCRRFAVPCRRPTAEPIPRRRRHRLRAGRRPLRRRTTLRRRILRRRTSRSPDPVEPPPVEPNRPSSRPPVEQPPADRDARRAARRAARHRDARRAADRRPPSRPSSRRTPPRTPVETTSPTET